MATKEQKRMRQPGAEQAREAEAALLSGACEKPGPTELFAVVDANGTLARGLFAVSAQRFSPGLYEVVFSRDVTHAALVACIGNSGSFSVEPPGMITTVGRFLNPNGVFIAISDAAGNPADRGFHLAVLSPQGFAAP